MTTKIIKAKEENNLSRFEEFYTNPMVTIKQKSRAKIPNIKRFEMEKKKKSQKNYQTKIAETITRGYKYGDTRTNRKEKNV